MIDIESKVIDTIQKAVFAFNPKAVVEDRYTASAASYPFVTVYEQNSSAPTRYEEYSDNELYTALNYEVQIYTNDRYKKATARQLAFLIDGKMREMGFNRTFMNPIPNVDRTIYRIAMRYTAIAEHPTYGETNNTIYLYHS